MAFIPQMGTLRQVLREVQAKEQKTTVAIANPKGGVGKSGISLSLTGLHAGIQANVPADEYSDSVAADGDPNPGSTVKIVNFNMAWQESHGQRVDDVFADMEDDPQNRTIVRFLAHPERGLTNMAIDFDFGAALREIGTESIARRSNHGLNLTTMFADTVKAHGIRMDHLGRMLIIPNNGSLQDLLDVVDTIKSTNQRYHKYDLFKDAIQQHLEIGNIRPKSIIFVDTAGERGYMSTTVMTAADIIIIPMIPTDLSLAGTLMGIRDARRVQTQRADVWRRPLIYLVPNALEGTTDEALFMNRALAQVQKMSTEQKPIYIKEKGIPYSRYFHDAGTSGTLEFFYNGLDPANLAIRDVYQELFGG